VTEGAKDEGIFAIKTPMLNNCWHVSTRVYDAVVKIPREQATPEYGYPCQACGRLAINAHVCRLLKYDAPAQCA
jgi:hypothetical protein